MVNIREWISILLPFFKSSLNKSSPIKIRNMDQDKDRLQGEPTKTTEETDVQKTTTTETGFEPREHESETQEKVEKSADEVVGDLQDDEDR